MDLESYLKEVEAKRMDVLDEGSVFWRTPTTPIHYDETFIVHAIIKLGIVMDNCGHPKLGRWLHVPEMVWDELDKDEKTNIRRKGVINGFMISIEHELECGINGIEMILGHGKYETLHVMLHPSGEIGLHYPGTVNIEASKPSSPSKSGIFKDALTGKKYIKVFHGDQLVIRDSTGRHMYATLEETESGATEFILNGKF